MTTYSVTLNVSSSNPSIPTTVTQNITSSDDILATITTPTVAFDYWDVVSYVGCTPSSFTGPRNGTLTITPTSGATSYSIDFETSRFSEQTLEYIYRYGRIQGTISGGATDTTPDAFTFTDQTNVALSSTITSNSITVSGINAASAISITGGTYSINGGAYTSSSGTVTNGQTVTVQHTSSASYSTATNTTLTIGGVSDTFTSTTLAFVADTTPDAFTFTDQTGVALSSTITSNTITVSGINSAASISVTGGTYSINGGAYTSATGTITNGQTVSVRHTSSASNSTATNTTLTIGGVSDTFTSTTLAAGPDTTPDAFTFTDQTNVALSTTITSNSITVSGINTAASISVTGGTYSINGGAYTATTGTVTNGQTVTVRHTSSASYSTATNTTLTIGGVSDTFTSTTLAFTSDSVPDQFTFVDQTNVAPNSVRVSNTITVSGINTAAGISVTGGEYSINGGTYTGASGTITNGQTVSVRHTSSVNYLTTVDTTLIIGGVADTFSSTTSGSGGGSGSTTYILQALYSSSTRAGRPITISLYTDDPAQLYWTINTTTANFAVVQGLTRGAIYGTGVFAVTPTTSCATGTYTVSLRTGGYSGTVVATLNIQVEAALPTNTFGMVVYDSSGNALLDTSSDTTRFLGSYTMTTPYTDPNTTPPYVDPPVQTNKGIFVFSPSFVSSTRMYPPGYVIGNDPSLNSSTRQPYVANRIYFTADTLPSSGSVVYFYGEF